MKGMLLVFMILSITSVFPLKDFRPEEVPSTPPAGPEEISGRNISVAKTVCSQFFFPRDPSQTEKSFWQKPSSNLKVFQIKYLEEEEIICRKSYAYILLGYLSGRNCYSLLHKPISFQRPSTLKSQNKSSAESNQLTDLYLHWKLVLQFQIFFIPCCRNIYPYRNLKPSTTFCEVKINQLQKVISLQICTYTYSLAISDTFIETNILR